MLQRGSGILMHLSSLPSAYGIGDMGSSARAFADFLSASGQRHWQMLPLNPTDGVYGESPYSSPSAFACSPLFISPELLHESGWLSSEEITGSEAFPADAVDYARVREYKDRLLARAFISFQKDKTAVEEFSEFCRAQDLWLDDYAMFMVLKKVYAGKRWNEWPQEIKTRRAAALKDVKKKYAADITYIKFLQYAFSTQWMGLQAHCRKLNLDLIGDIPIYVNEDSSDVWANPEFFKLTPDLRPQYVAGVPPDYFSETGQRWGNPVYDWDCLRKDRYAWWIRRLQRQFDLFGIVRIDHFRGFEAYWEIPADQPTAVNGTWVDGPKDDFFKIVQKHFADRTIIGEDLGIITEQVTALMKRFQIPGMKVLQFAFSGDPATHPYMPENYNDPCIVYTGTHDNNTTRGWFCHDASEEERRNLENYIQKNPNESEIVWDLITIAMKSRAVLSIIPLQDFLNLGREARMNVPGTARNNWRWRFSGSMPDNLAGQIKALVEQTARI
jgi:4-alpha-glucanotransferase